MDFHLESINDFHLESVSKTVGKESFISFSMCVVKFCGACDVLSFAHGVWVGILQSITKNSPCNKTEIFEL